MSFALGVCLLAVVTAMACALPGVFVVLRKNSMLVDAMSHAVFPGIVLGYFFTRDLNSPMLMIAAACAGLLVVLGSHWLASTGLLTGDAPQGLIFPALFSLGVIAVTTNFANIHLDTHAVLVGDLNLAAFEQFTLAGTVLGPKYLLVMLTVLIVNGVFVALTYERLKISTFDEQFSTGVGLRTGLLNSSFMFVVAMTVTASFNAAGAILVIAFVVIPPATAFLLARRLSTMIAATMAIAVVGAVGGFWVAYFLDAPTSAGIAVFYGVVFTATLIVVNIVRRKTTSSADPSGSAELVTG